MQHYRNDQCAGQRCRCCSEHRQPAEVEPVPPCRGSLYRHGLFCLLGLFRKKHDLAAAVAVGEMRQTLHPLVLRQHTFKEGVELVWIQMLAGLEKIVHVCFVPENSV
jgi:hypothetical protein